MATKAFVYILISLVFVSANNDIQICSRKGEDCSFEHSNHVNEPPEQKYSKDGNEHWSILQHIHEAKKNFQACAKNCSCHFPQIKRDLTPFKSGITQDMADSARVRGTLYQIIDGQLYREENCMFPSRCLGVEHFLHQIAAKIPNTEFVVNVRDYPQVSAHEEPSVVPVFSFSKKNGFYYDILYPAWSFWEGGPAIKLHPTGLGRWDIRRKTLINSSNNHKWSKKLDKAFFRGSRTSSDRDSIVLLSRAEPDVADAKYTKNQAWKSSKDTLDAEPSEEVSLEQHCQYKYLFNFHGVAASFRFRHLFLCGSVVFHEMDEWIEFFYPQMKPWIHYIPVPKRPTSENIRDLILFARTHDEEVHEIARKGRDFIADRLGMNDVSCYWKKLLKTYTKLLKYQPNVREELKLLPKKTTP